jgi:porin
MAGRDPARRARRRQWGGLIGLACAGAIAWPALAADQPPPLSLAMRETADIWGGEGLVTLNKFQVSGTVEGRYFGFDGWRAHALVFRTDGESLSVRVGDIQTVSNIEAISATRLFEAWVERSFGPTDKPVAVLRVGLLDLNADFDSIDPASLFINSSHGIGPDLSRSGLDGPSIFPVSAIGARLTWNASDKLTLKSAVFDGVAGDPARPRAFAAERLASQDGVLAIGEADDKLTDDLTLAAGVWAYSRALQAPFIAGTSGQPGRGVFASVSTATPKETGWAWWARAGLTNPRAQTVDGYLGAGAIYKGVFGRANDRMGFAIARADISDDARIATRLPRAETTYEVSYQAKIGETFALQPDVQYVVDPAGRPGKTTALVFGLRLIITGGYPTKAKPEDATDPTVPPDTPAAPDATKSEDKSGSPNVSDARPPRSDDG